MDIKASSICFFCLLACAFGQDLLGCQVTSQVWSSRYRCSGGIKSQEQCSTFAVLRTNSYYSSVSNLSSFLGINRLVLADVNGFPSRTEILPIGQPLLIPIACKCSNGFFEAELTKTTLKGESFNGIVQSLEGLTTCKALQENNPSLSPWNLGDKQVLLVPLKCSCPNPINHQPKFFISYPVSPGDNLATLATSFNTTSEEILSANERSQLVVPFSTLLIPVQEMPRFGSQSRLPMINRRKKKAKKKKMMGVYAAVAGIAFGGGIAIAATFLLIQRKKKKQGPLKRDVELEQLGLSVRTTTEKKASFEGSNKDSIITGQIIETTPRKALTETYTIEELKKGTEDFSSANLIEGSVYHGRLNGKNVAIKKTSSETISKVDFGLFSDAINHHPNIIRLVGTCISGGSRSYLVFEYAENGSLKDWLHGGLAMKSQFIASCDCFLKWNRRLKIALEVATALQFMHHIMNPVYVHRNIKSRNIFLDEEFSAKVGNFGMAKCVQDSGSWPSKGYVAPEYLQQGIISPGTDIFAYGIVLLEILSGQTPITRPDDAEVRLSDKIKILLQSENAEELKKLIDGALGENYSFDAAVTLANLARACVEDDPSLRPSAGEIVEKLSRLVEELPEGDQLTI